MLSFPRYRKRQHRKRRTRKETTRLEAAAWLKDVGDDRNHLLRLEDIPMLPYPEGVGNCPGSLGLHPLRCRIVWGWTACLPGQAVPRGDN